MFKFFATSNGNLFGWLFIECGSDGGDEDDDGDGQVPTRARKKEGEQIKTNTIRVYRFSLKLIPFVKARKTFPYLLLSIVMAASTSEAFNGEYMVCMCVCAGSGFGAIRKTKVEVVKSGPGKGRGNFIQLNAMCALRLYHYHCHYVSHRHRRTQGNFM